MGYYCPHLTDWETSSQRLHNLPIPGEGLNSGPPNTNARAFSTSPLKGSWLALPPLHIFLNLGRHRGKKPNFFKSI